MLNVVMPSVVMLSAIILNVTNKPFVLSVVRLNVVILSVVVLFQLYSIYRVLLSKRLKQAFLF